MSKRKKRGQLKKLDISPDTRVIRKAVGRKKAASKTWKAEHVKVKADSPVKVDGRSRRTKLRDAARLALHEENRRKLLRKEKGLE